MEEKLFPRGKPKSTMSSVKRKKSDSSRTNDDLFKAANNPAPKRKYKRFKTTQNVATTTVVDVDLTSAELLNGQTLPEDILVFGIVETIRKYQIFVSLPNGLAGTVSLTDISDSYTERLRNYAANNDDDQSNPSSLNDIFQVGTFVICKVKKIKQQLGKNSIIKLTLNPTELYADVSSATLQNGLILMAAVKSVEDHGYIMDIGMSGINAFLSNNMVDHAEGQSNGRLLVGQIIMCAVTLPENKSKEFIRSVALTAVTKQMSKLMLEKIKVPNALLLPGTMLSLKVIKMHRKGMVCQFHGRKVVVNAMHFSEPFTKKYEAQQTIRGRVLYTHPVTNVTYATLQNSHIHLNNDNSFGGLRFGDFVENAKVEKVTLARTIVSINNLCKGILKQSAADCESTEFKERFCVGSSHRCRISKLMLMDNILLLSQKSKFYEQDIINFEDVRIGDVMKCCVRESLDSGLFVTCGNLANCFIPNQYISDNMHDGYKKAYKPGKILKCRVIKLKHIKKMLVLTSRKSLLSNDLSIITSFEDAIPGIITRGIIIKELENGLLIAFYNNVVGYLSKSALRSKFDSSINSQFKLLDVVTCHIFSTDPEKNHIFLSLEASNENDGVMDITAEFEVGKIVSCTIVHKSDGGLDVNLSSGIRAFLPVQHLSDDINNCSTLLKAYQIGDAIKEVLCFSKDSVPVVTIRPLFISWVKVNEVPTKPEELKIGMMMPLVVQGIAKFGAFVTGLGHISGLVHVSKLNCGYVEDFRESKLSVHSTVIATVIESKISDKTNFSMKLSDCKINESMHLEPLINHITEHEFIRLKLADHGQDIEKQLCSVNLGHVIEFTVESDIENGVIGRCKGYDVKGVVSRDNSGDYSMDHGDVLKAVVIGVDFKQCYFHLTVENELLNDVSKAAQGNCTNLVGEIALFRRLLVNNSAIIGIVSHNGLKSVAYLPVKSHLNEIANLNYLANKKKEFHVKVISFHQQFLIVKDIREKGAKQTKPFIGVLKPRTRSETNSAEKTLIGIKDKAIKKKKILKETEYDCLTEKHIIPPATFVSSSKKISMLLPKIKGLQPAIVNKWKALYLYVDLFVEFKKRVGRIHISEIDDNIKEGSVLPKMFKRGQKVHVKVIGIGGECDGAPKSKINKSTTQKVFECSMRTGVLKGEKLKQKIDFKPDDSVLCFVNSHNKDWTYVSLNAKTNGRINPINLSDQLELVKEPAKHFKHGQAINARVICKGTKYIELSLTKTNVVHNACIGPERILSSTEDAIPVEHLKDEGESAENVDLKPADDIKESATSNDFNSKEAIIN